MAVGDERFLRGLYDLKYLFGDKWTPAILAALANGPLRRLEILSTISSYSIGEEWSDKYAVLHDSILARYLKKMTDEGLLTRTRSTETFPARVMYSLTPEVLEFLEIADRALTWVDGHPELIANAQAYRRQPELDDGDTGDDDED
jgi:DNA-binding HxlR family transcriptional regulator